MQRAVFATLLCLTGLLTACDDGFTVIKCPADLPNVAECITTGSAKCSQTLDKIADFPVTIVHQSIRFPAQLNGKPAIFLIDSGAQASLLRRQAVVQYGLRLEHTGLNMIGVGGESALDTAEVSIGFGKFAPQSTEMGVEDDTMRDPGITGVFGMPMITNFDVDFDLAHSRISLYQPAHCLDAEAALFSGMWERIGINTTFGNVYLPVSIAGVQQMALLDSGASVSTMGWDFAKRLKITRTTPGVMPAGLISGFGAQRVPAYFVMLKSIFVGSEQLVDLPVFIVDSNMGSNSSDYFVLGLDFFEQNRVFISWADGAVYVVPYHPIPNPPPHPRAAPASIAAVPHPAS